MQIAYVPSELNLAVPISRWWQVVAKLQHADRIRAVGAQPSGPDFQVVAGPQGHSATDMVVLVRARHQCFERTVQSPPWGVVGDRDRQVWVGYQWGG